VNDQTDSQLLHAYVERRSEAAFEELVRRHVDLVYSAALRMVRDAHLAEDVTQGAFLALAKSAAQLAQRPVLSGWLYRTAQNIAAQTVRTIERRRTREQEAAIIINESFAGETDAVWEQLAPHLDVALGELNETDREALLLRYFERKSGQEMARVLGVSDEAAQKRVSRAVERLREHLAKRGVTVGASGLVVTISTNAVLVAPAGLSATITTAALTGSTVATTAIASATKTIAMTVLNKTLIAAVLAGAIGTGIYGTQEASRSRTHVQDLERQHASLTAKMEQLTRERDDATSKLARVPDENQRLNINNSELLRLRGEVTRLRREREEALAKLTPVAGTDGTPFQRQGVDTNWVRTILDAQPRERGTAAGTLRGKSIREEAGLTLSEMALVDALLKRRENDTLERSPAAFADFQTAFIQAVLRLSDPSVVKQMHDLIEKTYEQAVANGLDIPSKPQTQTDAWVQRRHNLDVQATAQLKQLLSDEERRLFDLAFLGVMGVDLGGVGVDRSNYPKGVLSPE
jgi:RNA polymerase sigma factor (sigma-70 family)